jgi:hypothetical protein
MVSRYTSLLYLNPELPAFSNVRTIEAAERDWQVYGQLPHAFTPLPFGFDARVYLAAQADVSTLNGTIRAAMMAEGLSEGALQRRGTYVGTVMEPVDYMGLNAFALPVTSPLSFSACNLRPGDDVRLLRERGDPLHGRVVAVSDRGFTLETQTPYSLDPSQKYTLFGIKIWDPERQARVAWSRSSSPTTNVDSLPDGSFSKDVYQAVYPETRALSFADAYLDYRARWNRGREYRIAQGADIFNLRAPYSSNLLTPTRVPNLAIDGAFIAAGGALSAFPPASLQPPGPAVDLCSNLTVTHVNAALRSGITMAACNVIVTPSSVTVGPSGQTFSVDSGSSEVRVVGSNLIVNAGGLQLCGGVVQVAPSNVNVQTPLRVSERLDVGGAEAPPGLDAAVTVTGNVFTTGMVITQSDVRVKCQLLAIDDALGRLRGLRGYTYASKNDPGGRRHTGLLAQDVLRVLPEAVYGDPDTSSSIAYGNLAGLFVSAINTLADRVKQLEARINSHGTGVLDRQTLE